MFTVIIGKMKWDCVIPDAKMNIDKIIRVEPLFDEIYVSPKPLLGQITAC